MCTIITKATMYKIHDHDKGNTPQATKSPNPATRAGREAHHLVMLGSGCCIPTQLYRDAYMCFRYLGVVKNESSKNFYASIALALDIFTFIHVFDMHDVIQVSGYRGGMKGMLLP